MSQEFLPQVTSDMGREMFPDGSPTDSTYHVQNRNYRTCGEIVAVSLAQGGPPPYFLEQCALFVGIMLKMKPIFYFIVQDIHHLETTFSVK